MNLETYFYNSSKQYLDSIRHTLRGETALVTLLGVLLLLPGISHALTTQQEALVGLRGVDVVVEMNPQAERLGLTQDQIKTDVELRLRKAGVRILTKKESQETPGEPYLYVSVTIGIDQGVFACGIQVILREQVTLARGLKTEGTIWSASSALTAGTSKKREIRENVGDQVDKFINDYLAANPKK